MQVVIEIPEESIPQNQDILIVDLHFIDGQICECNYPFKEFPKNHGRLIDRDVMQGKAFEDYFEHRLGERDIYFVNKYIENAPTILEKEK